MTDLTARALHHLDEAARHTPGSDDERYHSLTASTYAALNAAAATYEQAKVGGQVIELQSQMLAVALAETGGTPAAPACLGEPAA